MSRPTLTPAQAHAILAAPGAPFETESTIIRGVPTCVWKNAPATLREVFLAGQEFADREFLVFEDERASFGAFCKAAARLATALCEAGVIKGDRVALAMRNMPEWPVGFFAAAVTGAIATPINPALARAEITATLIDCRAKAAVVDEGVMDLIAQDLDACPDLAAVYVSRSGEQPLPAKGRRLEAVIGTVRAWDEGEAPPLPDVDLAPDDDATLFYTSGTTGRPKGAVGSHRNIISAIRTNAVAQARATLLAGRAFQETDPRLAKPTTILLIFGLSHVAACCNSLVPLVLRGGKIVFMRWWSAEGAMKLIEAERINAVSGAPTMALQLMEHPARGRYDLSSLKYVLFGGAPAHKDLSRKVGEAFRAAPFCGYGMTETSASFTNLVGGEYLAHPESCGPASPVGEIRIMSLDGAAALCAGETGEIWLKGPQVVRGYWNRPDDTAAAFVDGWVRTGDIGRLDQAGYLTILDRAKDVIIRAGENIYCGEVESALKDHPAVADAAVIGLPHETYGEDPGAVVVLREGMEASERELRMFVRARLAAFKTPVRVWVTRDALPRNEAGKVVKGELRRNFAAGPQGAQGAIC